MGMRGTQDARGPEWSQGSESPFMVRQSCIPCQKGRRKGACVLSLSHHAEHANSWDFMFFSSLIPLPFFWHHKKQTGDTGHNAPSTTSIPHFGIPLFTHALMTVMCTCALHLHLCEMD